MALEDVRVLTVTEVCDYLRVHRSTIYRLLKRGDLPAFRIGSDWRFNVEAINVLRGIPRTLGSSVCLLTSGWYSALTVANRAAAESRSEP